MGRGRGLPRVRGGLPLRRRLAGYALAVVLGPLVTLFLASLRNDLNLTSDVLAFLVAVIAVALVGGFVPAVLEAIVASLLLNYYFTPPIHKWTIAEANNAAGPRRVRDRRSRGQLGRGRRGAAQANRRPAPPPSPSCWSLRPAACCAAAGPVRGAGPGPRGVRHGLSDFA